jgi:hypothetical protein
MEGVERFTVPNYYTISSGFYLLIMQFRTELQVSSASFSISHGDKVISLGSCFSEHVGGKLTWYGFNVLNNPFGTIFHPSALAELVRMALSEGQPQWRVFHREDLFLSLDAHSSCYGQSKVVLLEVLEQKRMELLAYLREAKVCIVTFGTAWGYYQEKKIVANCHKLPSNQFDKQLTDVSEMVEEWNEILRLAKSFNPHLEFVFTVSPVRHLKDGTVENQRAKARLIELVHAITESHYFPSYEILMDDLRDYRFYAEDLIHPSSQAVDYIFDKFSAWILDEKSCKLMAEIGKLRNRQRHKLLFSESTEAKRFEQENQELIRQFCQSNPKVKW